MPVALTADQCALAESVAGMMSRHVSNASTREAFADLARGQRGLT
jgi:hypothetical protein